MEIFVTDECASYDALDDDLGGIDRRPNAMTEVACGVAACTCVLTYKGLGEDRKPMLVKDQGVCVEA